MDYKRNSMMGVLMTLLVVTGLLLTGAVPTAAEEKGEAQAIVDKAKATFDSFMLDKNFTWFHDNLKNARGLLIFPQIIKAGYFVGGSGGTGVLVVRDEKTCDWASPAFYTMGSVSLGLQIGGAASEVIVMAMSQKAIDSLLTTSVKLGGDVSFAVGPVGEGAKANITTDFISFAKSKGLYAGVSLEGAIVSVRDGLNKGYYGKDVSPADIIVSHEVFNSGARELLSDVRSKATGRGGLCS